MLNSTVKSDMPFIIMIGYIRHGKIGWYIEIPAKISSTGKQEKIPSIFIMGKWIKLNQELSELLLGDIRKNYIDHPENKVDITLYKRQDRTPYLFSNFLVKWLRSKESCKPSTKKSLEIHAKYFREYFRIRDMRTLRRGDIEEFYQSLPDRLSKGYRATIMNSLQNLLSDFADWYEQRKVRIPIKLRSRSSPPVETIGRNTQRIIYSRIPKYYKPIFYILFFHGLRLGEGRALQAEDVFLEKESIIVRHNLSIDMLTTTKTEREREIPIDPELIGMLKEIMPKKGFVFTTPKGFPFHSNTLSYVYWKARKGITTVNLYSATRKAHATYLAKVKKFDVFTLMEYMGWTNINTAQKYVGKVDVQEIRLALAEEKVKSKLRKKIYIP